MEVNNAWEEGWVFNKKLQNLIVASYTYDMPINSQHYDEFYIIVFNP